MRGDRAPGLAGDRAAGVVRSAAPSTASSVWRVRDAGAAGRPLGRFAAGDEIEHGGDKVDAGGKRRARLDEPSG